MTLKIPDNFIEKPTRGFDQAVKAPPDGTMLHVYKGGFYNVNWGSDSNANFIDVLSVGPITSVQKLFVNEVDLEAGEFPKSKFFTHTGVGSETPWSGKYPYVERTYSISKQAEVLQEEKYSETSFKRQVSSRGVEAIRVNFTTGAFTQRDKENRVKTAKAFFKVRILDSRGRKVVEKVTQSNRYFASNPTSVQLTVKIPDDSYKNTLWTYEVIMNIKGKDYGVPVSGSWSASTVTEIYRDTQTYNDIAFCSGKIVADEVDAKTPKRQYLVSGYKVQVPKIQTVNGKDVFTGSFERKTSDSYAWNAMAVLTDTKWGAGLPIDKINIISFLEFDRYCSETINGIKRYSHSQYLIKADNYFKLAAQIVGNADGKLYEDTTGRIGILIDKQTNNRRVITTYDVKDEKVKRTTVPESKKINQVSGEFDDKTNNYKKTIIQEDDQDAIDTHGVITKKLKLDTCTDPQEARRILKRYLVTSQVATSSYVFEVGNAHEDIQIGDVVELYDRVYSRMNYCGKVGKGSTRTVIKVDKRTPVDLSGFTGDMYVKFDNNRGVPTKVKISSWTDKNIILAGSLPQVPEEFTSFGVEGSVSPTLIRVISTTDKKGTIQVEGVEYNNSLYSHVERGTPLVIPVTRYLPPKASDNVITGLAVVRTTTALKATWDRIPNWNYQYYWKRKGDTDPKGGITIKHGLITDSNSPTTSLDLPLTPALYTFHIRAFDKADPSKSTELYTKDYHLTVTEGGTSTIDKVSALGVKQSDNTIGSTYLGRDFTVKWDQTEPPLPLKLQGFILRVSQDGKTMEKRLPSSYHEYRVSEKDLIDKFGEEMKREFMITVITIDSNLLTSDPVTKQVFNVAPDAPHLTILATGDVRLSPTSGPIPANAVRSRTLVWKDGFAESSALVVETEDLENIALPDGTIVFDGSTYHYKSAWIDSFGTVGAKYGIANFIANPDLLVPVAPELGDVIPIDESTVLIKFTHDGTWFHKLRVDFRQYGIATWQTYVNEFTFPPEPDDTSHDYDPVTGEGFVTIGGLALNTEYEFKAQAANIASAWSEDSNIVRGFPHISADTSVIESEIEAILGTLDVRELIAEGVVDAFVDLELDKAIVKETINREDEDSQIVAEINKLTSYTEDLTKKSLSQFTTLVTLVTDTQKSIATKIENMETKFEDDFNKANANISNVKKLITEEQRARIAEVNKMDVRLSNETSERQAEIERLKSTIADGDQASASEINKIAVALETEEITRAAEILDVRRAIVTETNARASEISQLQTNVNNEIATAFDKATSAIGYCSIGGSPSAQDTQDKCVAAGGTWIDSSLAESVKKVQVSSGGKVATVEQFYQAYTDLEGDVVGKATIGVNSSGVFTGVEFIGSGTKLSSITFQGDAFKLKDTKGNNALNWDAVTNQWVFSGGLSAVSIDGGEIAGTKISGGTISGTNITGTTITGGKVKGTTVEGATISGGTINGATGNFSGTIFAKNIEGDVVDINTNAVNSKAIAGGVTTKVQLAEWKLKKTSIRSTVIVEGLYFKFDDTNNAYWYYVDIERDTGVGWETVKKSIVYSTDNDKETVNSLPLVFNTGLTALTRYRIVIYAPDTTRKGGRFLAQDVIVKVFKRGDTIEFN